jgi:hypothetical protein
MPTMLRKGKHQGPRSERANGFTALCWPLAPFHIFNIVHSRWVLLHVGSASRKSCTNTQDETNKIETHRHPYLERDSNPQSQNLRGRRQFMP